MYSLRLDVEPFQLNPFSLAQYLQKLLEYLQCQPLSHLLMGSQKFVKRTSFAVLLNEVYIVCCSQDIELANNAWRWVGPNQLRTLDLPFLKIDISSDGVQAENASKDSLECPGVFPSVYGILLAYNAVAKKIVIDSFAHWSDDYKLES